ncbi:hypothetical protein E6Q11_02630 [Candidatus Dojkabacteria bacterium]|uniref:Uncharacterized protein n=1 Tax=Candidatus Dojkabacteria bacterium TaxID=2099670 RepID=A0A5C7J800_9BACT|nr:MAG: hypothetical protein E6Q11_02630 [Candidatus Dojkabacteria bacterium]
MPIIREYILNEIRMKLVDFDHNGVPKEHVGEDQRETLLMMAALAVAAVEELDNQKLMESV